MRPICILLLISFFTLGQNVTYIELDILLEFQMDRNQACQIKMTEVITDFQFCPFIVPLVEGCTDPIAKNYNSSANIDDGSCLEEGCQVGDLAHGGIVFYVDETSQHGLVAALEDIGQFEWGCYGTRILGADGTAIGEGYQNTVDIVSQGCTTENGGFTAAQAALNHESEGYSDWYLPSLDELQEMLVAFGQRGGQEENIGGLILDGNPYLASSSMFSLYCSNCYAWTAGMPDFNSSAGVSKSNLVRVRVIRAF